MHRDTMSCGLAPLHCVELKVGMAVQKGTVQRLSAGGEDMRVAHLRHLRCLLEAWALCRTRKAWPSWQVCLAKTPLNTIRSVETHPSVAHDRNAWKRRGQFGWCRAHSLADVLAYCLPPTTSILGRLPCGGANFSCLSMRR
eukprot:3008184-Amphidinium_carterae.1